MVSDSIQLKTAALCDLQCVFNARAFIPLSRLSEHSRTFAFCSTWALMNYGSLCALSTPENWKLCVFFHAFNGKLFVSVTIYFETITYEFIPAWISNIKTFSWHRNVTASMYWIIILLDCKSGTIINIFTILLPKLVKSLFSFSLSPAVYARNGYWK